MPKKNRSEVRGKYEIGQFTTEELSFIEQNMTTHTPEWIAGKINRDPKKVKEWVARIKVKVATEIKQEEVVELKFELKNRHYYSELKKQFTAEELEQIENYWINYIGQFKSDVLPTEETQIVDLIRYEILINRNLKEQLDAEQTIERIERLLKREWAKPEEDQHLDVLAQLENQLVAARGSKTSRTAEQTRLQQEKNKLFESLKATREQRIKRIEDSKVNIFQLFKALEDVKFKEAEARKAELFKLSAEKEKERLFQYHEYGDGLIDIPILNEDSIKFNEEEIDEESIDNGDNGTTWESPSTAISG